MPLEPVIGELTLVDLHKPSCAVFWKGAVVAPVVSVMVFWKGANKKVTLRLPNPTTLGLSSTDLSAMQALHADMTLSGVTIVYGGAA